MSHDLDVLRLDFYMDILLGIPLEASDLLCVLFFNAEKKRPEVLETYSEEESVSKDGNRLSAANETDCLDGTSHVTKQDSDLNGGHPQSSESESDNKNLEATAPIELSEHSPATLVQSEHSPDTLPQSIPLPTAAESGWRQNAPILTTSLSLDDSMESDVENYFRASFFVDRDSQDLKNASAVVEEEEKLERAVALEQMTLREKKLFIPLLKSKPFRAKSNSGD